MSNFEFNVSSANTDSRIMNVGVFTPDIKTTMTNIKCNKFTFKSDGSSEENLGFISSSVKDSLAMAVSNSVSTEQPMVIPSKYIILLSPAYDEIIGPPASPTTTPIPAVEKVAIEASPDEPKRKFFMTVTDNTVLNLQENIKYRFYMEQTPVNTNDSGIVTEPNFTEFNEQIDIYAAKLKKGTLSNKEYTITGTRVSDSIFVFVLMFDEDQDQFPFDHIFLYGEEVSTFDKVDKDKIFALHHLAIQDIYEKIG